LRTRDIHQSKEVAMDRSLARQQLQEIFQAGLDAVDPYSAVLRSVERRGEELLVAGKSYSLEDFERVWVIGAGKAGAPMAQAVEQVLGDRIEQGRVTVKYGHTLPLEKVEILEADHPVPDQNGIAATEQVMELARGAGEKDLVFCLISGGGSALLVCPAAGIGLPEIQSVTSELLSCGASIGEINALRKHLSQVKGGQLARLCAPATVITMILSDVVGDPLDVIASGPTVPDASTFSECMEIVERYGLAGKLPGPVMEILRKGKDGGLPENPQEGDPVFDRVQKEIVGNNLSAVLAASEKASALGYKPLILSTRMEGETKIVARVHADIFREVRDTGFPAEPPLCILSGGETTVTLKGSGKGGRNMEFSLAAALHIRGKRDIYFLSGGTDGTDGPTDAAGAFADGSTVERAEAIGLNAESYLEENDSYTFFQKLGDLLITGPTKTNVMDLRVCILPQV
jgi:glycerate 2-kinase